MPPPDSPANKALDGVSFPADKTANDAQDKLREQAVAHLGEATNDKGNKEKLSGITGEVPKPVIVFDDRERTDELTRAAEAIHDACSGVSMDSKTIKAILRDRTWAERHEIDMIYYQKFRLFLDQQFAGNDAERDELVRLLNKRDGSADDAG